MKKYFTIILILLSTNLVYAENNLTLETCKALAIQNNIKIQNSQLELDSAKQIKNAAFTKFFPSISAGGSIFQAANPLMEMTIAPGMSLGFINSGTFGIINVIQPLFAGGRIMNGNKLADIGVNANQYKLDLARKEVLFKTEEQYWQIVALKEKLKTIATYQIFLTSLDKQVQDAKNSGLAMKNDVMKVKLKQSELLLNKAKLESGIKLATMSFCQTIGIDYNPSLQLTEALKNEDVEKQNHKDLLQTRNEYKLLQAGVDVSSLQTQMQLGEYLPQVGVGVSGLLIKLDSNRPKTDTVVYGMVQIPISNWWEASYKLDEQNKKEQIARNNLKDTSEMLLLQMEKAYQDLTDAKNQVSLCEEAQKQAYENLKVNQDSYKNGISSTSDLLEAEALLQQTNDQLIEAKTKCQICKLNYLHVTKR